MDKSLLVQKFNLTTEPFRGSTDFFYQPNTQWPRLPFNYFQLHEKYGFDITLLKKYVNDYGVIEKAQPIRMGKGKNRPRYKAVGLTYRQGIKNIYYDAAEYQTNDGSINSSTVFPSQFSEYKARFDGTFAIDNSGFNQKNDLYTGYVEDILNKFNAQITKVRFSIMEPGGFLLPHFDSPYYQEVRLHAVVETNPKVFYEIEGERFQIPADGHFYFFDAGKVHSVYNLGDTPRIVLTVHLNCLFRSEDRIKEDSIVESLHNL